jgi:integrase
MSVDRAREDFKKSGSGVILWRWHTFRHTFGTILNANRENLKVIQELMRHANLKVTMDIYVQAVTG